MSTLSGAHHGAVHPSRGVTESGRGPGGFGGLAVFDAARGPVRRGDLDDHPAAAIDAVARPFEVESALITHPAVLEAAVVPEADPEGLLKPKAFVVLRSGATTDGLHEALKEHVKQKIGPWKYPRWIDVVESLPKTATGKIQRFKLRDTK